MSVQVPRIRLAPLSELDGEAWRRIHAHFRDPEISHLNGSRPSRLPLWVMRPMLRASGRAPERHTFGIIADGQEFIGLTELYDVRDDMATLGIIIGERDYWGRGYGTLTVRQMLQFAFGELGLNQVRLATFEDNLRAQASFHKAGFREMRRESLRGDRGRLSVWMGISRERWQAELKPQVPQKTV